MIAPSTPAELLAAMERLIAANSTAINITAWQRSEANAVVYRHAKRDIDAQLALIAELLDVIEASAELLSHSDDCDTNSTRSADEIEADYHRPCDCMFHAVDTMAARFTTPEWREVAQKLTEAR